MRGSIEIKRGDRVGDEPDLGIDARAFIARLITATHIPDPRRRRIAELTPHTAA